MSAAISRRRARQKKLGSPPMRVQPMEYMDTLAGEIGARPRLLRHPLLLRHLLAGPLTAAQYRLDGSGRWKGAADAIRRARRQPSGEKSRR
jgi:dimethylaniline monooxygenase (N-oxide forming)